MDHVKVELIASFHRADLQQEAARQRLLAEVDPPFNGVRRLIGRIGYALIRVGWRLERLGAPPTARPRVPVAAPRGAPHG